MAAKRTAIGGSGREEEGEELPGPPSVRLADEVDVLDGAADGVHGPSAGPRRPRGDPLRHAQPRRARAPVLEDLLGRRADRLLRDEGEDPAARADADRERRRAAAAGRALAEGVLDDPVLERVVREDGEARAEREARDRVVEEPLELDELAVRRDAQRLEDARRRVAPFLAPAADGLGDEGPELARRPDRGRLARLRRWRGRPPWRAAPRRSRGRSAPAPRPEARPRGRPPSGPTGPCACREVRPS